MPSRRESRREREERHYRRRLKSEERRDRRSDTIRTDSTAKSTLRMEINKLVLDGYRVVSETDDSAQLVKPKAFSFPWALFWFLFLGIGVAIYIFYYMAKEDTVVYLTVSLDDSISEVELGGFPVRRPRVSIAGVLGAGLAIVILIAIGAAFLSDSDEMYGLMFPVLAILFIPALVVSATAIPRRKGILQATTVAAVLIALGGWFVDFGIPLIMALPTVLLAQAAGLLFGAARD